MIRVLQFASCINRYDFIDNIVQHANPQRFQVGVCVRSLESGIAEPVYAEQTPRWIVPWGSRRSLHLAAWHLARILRSWRADILHTHHYDEAVIGWMATRLYSGTRLVVGRHYSDAIYRSSSGSKRKLLLAVEQVVNRAATRIVVPSNYIFDILTRWQRINLAKVDHVPYGFVEQKYAVPHRDDIEQLRAELGLHGHFSIGNFSRLHEEKGHRFLIQAMTELRSRFPDILLLIVGEGPERANLERQVGIAGLRDVVRLLGWRRDAMTLMAAVDAVVQPTLQEAFSQVMVEALWMRKPIVITQVSGATDIIRDGDNGILAPKNDPDALASAITRLAEDDPLRHRLGQAGRAYVDEHLSIEKVIPQYEQVYLRAMGAEIKHNA